MPLRWKPLRRPLAAAGIACFVALQVLGAQADLPMDTQVPLLLRVLSYDRALARNGTGDVVIAVLYDAASSESNAARTTFARAVRASGITAVNGRTLRLVEVNVAAGQVGAVLQRHRATAAYLTPGLEGHLAAVVAGGEASRALLLSGNARYVRSGVAVGVGTQDGRPRLFINLPAARAAGSDLPAALLQIATVTQ